MRVAHQVTRASVPIRPTAWFWWVLALTSIVATVGLAMLGALVSFAGADLSPTSGGWSIAFWLVLFASIASFCVSIVLLPATRRREVRAGYTTVPTMAPQAEWRDHATGLVLRQPGEPTPTGSIGELRRAAEGRRDGFD